MGRATVLSGGTDGLYQVQLDGGQATKTARLAALATRLAALAPEVTRAQGLLSVQQVLEAMAEAAVASTIAAYVAATRLAPPDTNAVQAALKEYVAAQAKLTPEKASTGQLRAALQLLEDEQAQLQKDQARWAALVVTETASAWCADLTEDATGSVATLEIPGENKLVLIAPAAPAPTAGDGLMTAREVQSPGQVFWNAAVLPGWQKWMPTYRRGVITAIDAEKDTADVTLEASDTSSAQGLVIDQAPTLARVPVQYMTCHTDAFLVGDRCVVKFKDHDWAQPVVVGFVDHPRGCVSILSGVVKGGTVVDIGAGRMALDRYRPTANAWQFPLRADPAKSPVGFHNETFLAKAGTQYARLRPTMYSGLMARAVQIIMGRGRVVAYDYRWATCHGISQGPDGRFWLVQISAEGVLAMLLPMDKGSASSSTDALAQATLLFGGKVPSGDAFLAGAALSAGLAAGTVKVLLGATGLADFYDKTGFASTMGWSFNDAGSEAHNTCHHTVGAVVTSYHYKLTLSFFAGDTPPVAALVLVSQGPLTKKQYEPGGPFAQVPLYIWDHQLGAEVPIPAREVLYDELDVDSTAPLIACHINGALEVLRVKVQAEGSFEATNPSGDYFSVGVLIDSWTTTQTAYRAGRRIVYDSQPLGEFGYDIRHGEVSSISTTHVDGTTYKAYAGTGTARVSLTTDGSGGFVLWGRLARDSFTAFETPCTTYITHGGESWNVSDLEAAEGLPAHRTESSAFNPPTGETLPGYVWVTTGPSAWVAVPGHTDISGTKPVTFYLGMGAPLTLPDADGELRDMDYVDVTYSVFGSAQQQVAITAPPEYHFVGDLLTGEPAEPVNAAFTFVGYT